MVPSGASSQDSVGGARPAPQTLRTRLTLPRPDVLTQGGALPQAGAVTRGPDLASLPSIQPGPQEEDDGAHSLCRLRARCRAAGMATLVLAHLCT